MQISSVSDLHLLKLKTNRNSSWNMGHSNSKGKISSEDLQFLLKNTNKSKEEIVVNISSFLYNGLWMPEMECNKYSLCSDKTFRLIQYFSQSQTDCVSQEWHAGFMEDCPDGELTKEQFVDMYNKIFPGGRADRYQKKVYTKVKISRRILDFQKSFSALLMRTEVAQSTSASSC